MTDHINYKVLEFIESKDIKETMAIRDANSRREKEYEFSFFV